jgi:hypothetical protein
MSKTHHHDWKKTKSGKAIQSDEFDKIPEGIIHIDQLKCSQPRLISQTKGQMGKDHYNVLQLSSWMASSTMDMSTCSALQMQSRHWWQSMILNNKPEILVGRYAPIMETT